MSNTKGVRQDDASREELFTTTTYNLVIVECAYNFVGVFWTDEGQSPIRLVMCTVAPLKVFDHAVHDRRGIIRFGVMTGRQSDTDAA